jgi:hypothetical protein
LNEKLKEKKRKKSRFPLKVMKNEKNITTPHPSLKAPYPPNTPLLNEFKVSLLFRYSLTNCLFYLDKEKGCEMIFIKSLKQS